MLGAFRNEFLDRSEERIQARVPQLGWFDLRKETRDARHVDCPDRDAPLHRGYGLPVSGPTRSTPASGSLTRASNAERSDGSLGSASKYLLDATTSAA